MVWLGIWPVARPIKSGKAARDGTLQGVEGFLKGAVVSEYDVYFYEATFRLPLRLRNGNGRDGPQTKSPGAAAVWG